MAQEERNRLTEWLLLLRSQAPILRQGVADWLDAVREEPRLAWETAAVRYAVYGASAVVLVLVVTRIPALIGPPAPPSAQAAATTADYHVICSRQECGHHFVVNRKFGFHSFPVDCPKCNQRTGAQALRCSCGRWVLPEMRNKALTCPVCGHHFGPAP